jgi:aminoglycoside/choline kinase family phosphotransferase
MPTIDIPKTPDALSAAWLTEALRLGGTGDAKVTSFDYEPIAAGVGFLGKLGRLHLHHESKAGDLPRTLIAKQPTLDEKSRQLAKAFRLFEREVAFYREIGSAAGIRVPALHYGDVEAASGDFIMLLEDLAPARVGDQLESCTADEARRAIAALARCHAAWWGSPRLGEFAWLPNMNDPMNHFSQFAYQACWAPFVQFVGDKLSPALKRTGEAFATRIITALDGLASMPLTLSHGDFRADNLFFSDAVEGVGDGMALVDWQLVSRGSGAFDVAYFLSGNLRPDVRRAAEKDLLQFYVTTLREHGVQNYGFEQCFEEYRFSTLFCLLYAVIVIGTLDPTNARGLAMFHANFERVAAAITDLDAGALMPS